ncbi:glycosyltransferase family 2 protein [Bradyrhizobium sp. CCBAU 51627]|uniref:glycosyltransferase family 2 protein n=1 Tax=Bradyrhizobium sp. CCBAU 51627 TaxID=1325088 RepID=UPI0023053502|nr:glycosyltransferase family 2 protein [Bradyrhizobium sp. CCBAU 51627]
MKIEILMTRAAMVVSALALMLGLTSLIYSMTWSPDGLSVKKLLLVIVFCAALLSLFYGNIVYQMTRLGQIRRHFAHQNDARDPKVFRDGEKPPRVSIVIPSYKEHIAVVMQTVLSAALSEYANRRITVLIDDPPGCTGADLVSLNATRELIDELDDFFHRAAQRFRDAAEAHHLRMQSAGPVAGDERIILADLYEEASEFVDIVGRRYAERSQPAFAHSDEVFAREVIRRLSDEHRARAARFRYEEDEVDPRQLRLEYQRLISLFAAPIHSFERKRFANLSHAPNKAMNLNSYIGLMGRAFRVLKGSDGAPILLDCDEDEASFAVPAADYVVTIDADSIILPGYITKLVSIMEADSRIAIAQTPYSAYPNPSSVLERVAGATTDIQYLVHQGFTAFNATFWVGANAVLRYAALDEIRTMVEERGHTVPIFIQDKTLIEDTGSTVDLVARGWRLYNHPERLAYSATPPDFGALVIQRRRWANGGLIIFPGVLELWRGRAAGWLETLIRSHYLLSPALANIGLLLLLVVPFGREFSNVWFPIAAAPYYLLYGRDLVRCGYKGRDILRVYALTLLLIPINLAGVYSSVEQIMTGRKSAFARTPKIEGRTAAPASHLISLAILLITAVVSALLNLWSGNLLFFGFSAANVAFFLYGFGRLIGWREALVDVKVGIGLGSVDRESAGELAVQLAEEPAQ